MPQKFCETDRYEFNGMSLGSLRNPVLILIEYHETKINWQNFYFPTSMLKRKHWYPVQSSKIPNIKLRTLWWVMEGTRDSELDVLRWNMVFCSLVISLSPVGLNFILWKNKFKFIMKIKWENKIRIWISKQKITHKCKIYI